MGGDIHVREAEGGGSAFEFTVRTRDAHDQAVDPHPGEVVLPLVPASSVLVVDDQEINRHVVVAMLRKMGYTRVAVAHGGAEAVPSLLEAPVDVVLMDVQMPEVDGIEATRRILTAGCRAPYIVALTANALESDRQRCLDAGMNDYLAKPLTFDALRTVMFRAERAVRTQARQAR
jgi:CheY-like chemotaxis protein